MRQTVIEQAQPPGPQPPQPPAPATAPTAPEASDENAANTDSFLSESPSQIGQGASSSIRLIGRSLSNLWLQVLQTYS
jgi:hypothetical protein